MTDYPTTNHGPARSLTRLIVLHSTESPAGSAHAVAWAFQDPGRRASAHYVVGTDGVVSCVPEELVAWAAPGANHDGIHIEQCGYAGSTDWTSGDGLAVLTATAPLVADIAARWNIPLRALTDEELAAGEAGICTHAAVSRVYRKSDHWDPGTRYPLDRLLGYINPTTTPTTPTIQEETMTIIRTKTPWGADAYALITEHSAAALDANQAQAYAAACGRVADVPWDYWNLLIREAWQRREALMADMGRTMGESVDAAVQRVIDAAKEMTK